MVGVLILSCITNSFNYNDAVDLDSAATDADGAIRTSSFPASFAIVASCTSSFATFGGAAAPAEAKVMANFAYPSSSSSSSSSSGGVVAIKAMANAALQRSSLALGAIPAPRSAAADNLRQLH